MATLRFIDKCFVLLQHCIPQHALSRLVGRLAECRIPWLKNFLIRQFIDYFSVDMSEALEPDYPRYPTFNDFFTRPLRPGARVVDTNQQTVVSPTDGTISESGKIDQQKLIQAKGHYFELCALLGGDKSLTGLFSGGEFATIYLSPRDYHRVHMPIAGRLQKTLYIPGRLFSVNATTTSAVPNLFARNERLVCLFETTCGPMALILVGAMIVAGIETVWSGQVTPKALSIASTDYSQVIELDKGEELGRFKLGSTVIMLFPQGRAQWLPSALAGASVQMGEALGKLC